MVSDRNQPPNYAFERIVTHQVPCERARRAALQLLMRARPPAQRGR